MGVCCIFGAALKHAILLISMQCAMQSIGSDRPTPAIVMDVTSISWFLFWKSIENWSIVSIAAAWNVFGIRSYHHEMLPWNYSIKIGIVSLEKHFEFNTNPLRRANEMRCERRFQERNANRHAMISGCVNRPVCEMWRAAAIHVKVQISYHLRYSFSGIINTQYNIMPHMLTYPYRSLI